MLMIPPEPSLVFIIVTHRLSLAYIESFFAVGFVGSLLSHLLLATALERNSPTKTSFIISSFLYVFKNFYY